MKRILRVLLTCMALSAGLRAEPAPSPDVEAKAADGPVRVVVIPVREQIAEPVHFVIRRGLKDANERGAKAVVLDMETPGGALGTALEIMEALDKFEGETITYVNKEAISAGAIISAVTDEIHFAPNGIIGAAAAITSTGEDIPETLKLKLNSYLKAKVRSFSEGKGYRADVISAMIDPDYEFKIGDTVIKPKGELLSLTATEAAKTYGEPPQALLAAGVHENLEKLLDAKFGQGGYEIVKLEVTWSEQLASWLVKISPILMGLGLLGIFIEFKTPGFGIFGIGGGLLLALVFFGHYIAGLSGHEAALVFVVGVVLVLVELFFLPGTVVPAVAGIVLMLGALAWSMVDYWPSEPLELTSDLVLMPLTNVALGVTVAVVAAALTARFLPRGWIWDRLVLSKAVGDGEPTGQEPDAAASLVGHEALTVSVLRPAGQIEIGGRRYEARVAVGAIGKGERVRVIGRQGFELLVEKEDAS